MTLFSYLTSKYMEANIKNRSGFSLSVQADSNAAHNLIGLQRKVLTLIGYIKLMIGYLMVQSRISTPPLSEEEQIKQFTVSNQNASKIDSKASTSSSGLVMIPTLPTTVTNLPTANELKD